MPKIHPTAIVAPDVRLADDVEVGPYSILTGPLTIGAGTVILSHCVIGGPSVIGRDCRIGPAAYVGVPPQHINADHSIGRLIVGDRVTIRETATIHRSIAAGDELATKLGDDCFVMAAAHIGHNSRLGKSVIAAHGMMLGGHCLIGDNAFLGGGCAVHQFVRVGRLAIIGGNEKPTKDVPPFGAVRDGGLKGYNAIGCKRSGMSRESIAAIRGAYHALHTNRTMPAALKVMQEMGADTPEVRELLGFLTTTKRGVLPSKRNMGED
jgi:UDP-N-acetylglucosamine acyltransferase